MGTMNEIIDSRAFASFCGIDSSNQVPDGDTIGRFRAMLVENGLQAELFGQVVTQLTQRGLILRKGTIVDSTIISAPPSTKNRDRKRDPDAHQTKKGNSWHFGYKAHIGADDETGLVHSLEITGANVHDVAVTPCLLTGSEETVTGDSGYLGADKRMDAILYNDENKRIRYRINRRPSQYRTATGRTLGQIKRREREKSSIRAKVEHVFGVVKVLFKYHKTRYKGLLKQTSKLHMMFALANLYLAEKRYCSTLS
jgi:IS5 family transposase